MSVETWLIYLVASIGLSLSPGPNGLLALTHLSSRYAGGEILDESLAVFERTVVPRDFDTIDLPLPERGEPQLVRWEEEVPT